MGARDSASLAFTPPERFQIVRRLGAGGMGVVYEALDREKGGRVALKTLLHHDPQSLARLKREFRALQDIHHPNLVGLGELISERDQWFFTLELVDGIDFLTYVCPRPATQPADEPSAPLGSGDVDLEYDRTHRDLERADPELPRPPPRAIDEPRLRDAVAQLAAGLVALHDAGKVHRDVKPSNVLVTPDGRVVLLDFGLIGDASRTTETLDEQTMGTPAYMAPEQATSSAVGTEADCYALGVMMYQALTGRLPYEGSALQMLMRKQVDEPVKPSAITPDAPPDLEDMCLRLLRFAPDARPTAREVQAFLRPAGLEPPPLRTHSALTRSALFVGRTPEMGALEGAFADACDGRPIVVLVEGESGIGKTCLVRTFAERQALETPDLVVLAGRCYEREAVPYKALDGVVDDLTRRLARMSEGEAGALLPSRAGALLQVFPAFRRVPLLARKPTRGVVATIDPRELRRRAFVALREILVRLSNKHRLLVVIDDLQWGDVDSFSALAEVLHGAEAPSVLLVATVRAGADVDADPAALTTAGMARSLPAEVRTIRLAPLSDEDALAFAGELLRTTAPEHAFDAAAISREAAGYPLFIDELVRFAANTAPSAGRKLRLDDVLWQRVSDLDADARTLVILVATAGTRFPQEAMVTAFGKDASAFDRTVSLLRVAHLVRTDSRDGGTIEPYHDRVREAVVARRDAASRVADHERLAMGLHAMKNADPEALATHWHAAGDAKRAAAQAALAGASAAAALAFDRAAHWYARALEWSSPGDAAAARALRVKLGDALANAGRGALAASQFRAAAAGGDAAESLDLRYRASSELLRCGHLDEGIAALREVLASIGVTYPDSPFAALVRLLFLRLVLFVRGLSFTERETSEISTSELTRIDTLYAVAASLGPVDTIRGQMFQGHHVLGALRAGDPRRVSRAISAEAAYRAIDGEPTWGRIRPMLLRAESLAERTGAPDAMAVAALAHGTAALLAGRSRESHERLVFAERVFREQCVGRWWEIAMARRFYTQTLVHTGDIRTLCERKAEYLRDALERGDLYLATNLQIGFSTFPALAEDAPDRARKEIMEGMALWTKAGFHVEHHHELMGYVFADLYEGLGVRALARITDARRSFGRSLLNRIQLVRIEFWYLRARSMLAAIVETGDRARLGAVTRDARRITAERTTWGAPVAAALTAAVAWQRGRDEEARAELREATRGFEATDGLLFAAATRLVLGTISPGDAGARDVAAAEAWMRGQTIREPSRVARMIVPGFARRAAG